MFNSHQFYFRILIECELIVILGGVELLVSWAESTSTDVVHLRGGMQRRYDRVKRSTN